MTQDNYPVSGSANQQAYFALPRELMYGLQGGCGDSSGAIILPTACALINLIQL